MIINKEEQLCLKIFNNESYNYLLPLVDWEIVYRLLCSQRLFNYGYKIIKEFIPDSYKNMFKIKHVKYIFQRMQYIREIKKIATKLRDNKIRFILVKGLSFSNCIYKDSKMRETSDIDLLVNEKDILKIDGLLRDIKYIPIRDGKTFVFPAYKGYKPPNNLEVFDYISHKENLSFTIEIQRFIHGVFKNEYISDFFENTEWIDIDGCLIEIMSLENNFIHLITNTYINSHIVTAPILKTAHLRDYVDIKEFYKRHSKLLDWNHIYYKVKEYGLDNTFRIVLTEANQVFSNTIPTDIISQFNNERNERSNLFWYEDVTIPVWKSSIIDIMFNPNKNESSEIIFEKSYSKFNPNYNLPINIKNNCVCCNFIDEKYEKLRFQYIIQTYENGLAISFKFANSVFCLFNYFNIAIIFLVKDKKIGIHETHFTVIFDQAFECFYKKQEVFSHIIVEETKNEVLRIFDDHIELRIPYDLIADDLINSSNRKLSYKIQLMEDIQGIVKGSIDEFGYKEYAPKILNV